MKTDFSDTFERLTVRALRAGCGLAAVLALGAWSAPAQAQQAIGNGQGLQRNLSRFGNYNFQNRSRGPDNRFQNSVLYGNAPGGLSFQGNLGSRNPFEFQGKLGTNDLYKFNRDSAFSGLGGAVRGSTLQDYQGALSRGERGLSTTLGGVFNYQRNGTTYGAAGGLDFAGRSGANRRDTFTSGVQSTRLGASSLTNSTLGGSGGADGQDSLQSTLRSTLESSLNANLGSPGRRGGSVGGGVRSFNNLRSGRTGASAEDLISGLGTGARSGVLGQTFGGEDDDTGLSGAAAEAAQQRRMSGANRISSAANNRVTGVGPTGTKPELAVPDIRTSYDELRERLDKLGEPSALPVDTPDGKAPTDPTKQPPADPTRLPGAGDRAPEVRAGTWESRMNELRSALAGAPGKKESVTLLGPSTRTRGFVDPKKSKSPGTPTDPLGRPVPSPARPGAAGTPGQDGETGEPAKPGIGLTPRIDPKTLQIIRDAGGTVKTLSPTVNAPGRDFFAEHMRAGEELLSQSMFFDAEERFVKATQAKPGDLTAYVGQVHAQMGAGLFLSAGTNLRRVLASAPEACAQRYAAVLLPSPKRIDHITLRLRDNQAVDGPIRRESALLMAYVGFQTSDRALAEEGLNAMTKAIGQDPTVKPGEDEHLIELLRGVWLDDKFYKPLPPLEPYPKPEADPQPAPPGEPEPKK